MSASAKNLGWEVQTDFDLTETCLLTNNEKWWPGIYLDFWLLASNSESARRVLALLAQRRLTIGIKNMKQTRHETTMKHKRKTWNAVWNTKAQISQTSNNFRKHMKQRKFQSGNTFSTWIHEISKPFSFSVCLVSILNCNGWQRTKGPWPKTIWPRQNGRGTWGRPAMVRAASASS